jgi:hypothetical protein
MTLLVILLGTITKMALVSADCHIDTTNIKENYTEWTNVGLSVMPQNALNFNV